MDLTTSIGHSTCEIVTLTVGPFRFEVLGVVIHFDPVVLTLSGDSMGGLVGRWLCALADGSWIDLLGASVNQLLAMLG